MSLIGEALKKNKNSEKSIVYKKKIKFNFNIPFLVILIIIMFFLIGLLDYKLINKTYSIFKNKNYPQITTLKKEKHKKIADLEKKLASLKDEEILINLSLNNKSQALKIINESKDDTLLGIYYFKENNLNMAKSHLLKCYNLSKKPYYKALCGYYLALFQYKLKKYKNSIDILNDISKIKGNNLNCEINLLYAVNFDSLGNKEFSKIYYDKSLKSCNIPPIKLKLKIKKFIMEYTGIKNES